MIREVDVDGDGRIDFNGELALQITFYVSMKR